MAAGWRPPPAIIRCVCGTPVRGLPALSQRGEFRVETAATVWRPLAMSADGSWLAIGLPEGRVSQDALCVWWAPALRDLADVEARLKVLRIPADR